MCIRRICRNRAEISTRNDATRNFVRGAEGPPRRVVDHRFPVLIDDKKSNSFEALISKTHPAVRHAEPSHLVLRISHLASPHHAIMTRQNP
jgi:hypothetical protein